MMGQQVIGSTLWACGVTDYAHPCGPEVASSSRQSAKVTQCSGLNPCLVLYSLPIARGERARTVVRKVTEPRLSRSTSPHRIDSTDELEALYHVRRIQCGQ